jgi:hypothetical protein
MLNNDDAALSGDGMPMTDAVGRLPVPEAPPPSPAAGPPAWSVTCLRSERPEALGGRDFLVDLRLTTPWADLMGAIDAVQARWRDQLQDELEEAAALSPALKQLAQLEAAAAAAEAPARRKRELEAERKRLLGQEGKAKGKAPSLRSRRARIDVDPDLADRLAAIDAELAGLASADEASGRMN